MTTPVNDPYTEADVEPNGDGLDCPSTDDAIVAEPETNPEDDG